MALVWLAAMTIGMAATNVGAQDGGHNDPKEVPLKKGARTNGFDVIVRDGRTYLSIIMVIDPKTKKPAIGEWRVKYRCEPGDGLTFAPPITLFNGSAATVWDTCSRPFVTSIVPVVG